MAALAGAALLTACTPKDDTPPPMSEGRVMSKWIEDWEDPEPCYKFSLSKVEEVWNKKHEFKEKRVYMGYECVPTRAYDSLDVGDYYRQSDWRNE